MKNITDDVNRKCMSLFIDRVCNMYVLFGYDLIGETIDYHNKIALMVEIQVRLAIKEVFWERFRGINRV